MAQSVNHPGIPTIIVSRPGVMRQSLRATLVAYPGITVITTTGDGLTALMQVVQHRPRLLVIDSNLLDEEVEALLTAVKAQSPQTHCLVCVQSSQRQARLLALGAEAVIGRDSSPQELQDILSRLTEKPLA